MCSALGNLCCHLYEKPELFAPGNRATTPHTRCELGCGTAYCSVACRSAAAPWHHLLCVGPVDEDHALYRFKLAAYSSGALAEFILSAQLAVKSLLESTAGLEETAWRLAAGASLPWWELRPVGIQDANQDEIAQYRADAEEVASDSWALLCEGVPQLGQTGRTAADWARLLAAVAAEKVELSRASTLEVACRQAWNDGGAATLNSDVRAGMLSLARDMLMVQRAEEPAEDATAAEDEEGREDDTQQQNEEQREQQEEIPEQNDETDDSEQILARILADPASFLPRFEAAAVYPTPRLSHSCAPTCVEELSDPPVPTWLVKRALEAEVATKPPRDTGMELRIVDTKHGVRDSTDENGVSTRTVCVVDCSLSEPERGAELIARGRAPCYCARCRFERAVNATVSAASESPVAAVSTADLTVLVELAKSDGRHKDAIALLDEILQRQTASEAGDALLSRARVIGWDDRWSESHEAMVSACATAPTHSKLRTTLDATLSYAGWNPAYPVSAAAEHGLRRSVHKWSPLIGLGERAFVAPALLDMNECAEMIVAVESQLQGNWTTSRHYSVPATDVPVYQVPVVARWFNSQLAETIYPMLGEQFGVAAESIRIIDAFVVRYSADKQRSLPLHCDQSQFSLTIALNSRDDYTGGGTFFADTGEAANADAGGVISFDGSLMHSVRRAHLPLLRPLSALVIQPMLCCATSHYASLGGPEKSELTRHWLTGPSDHVGHALYSGGIPVLSRPCSGICC